MQEEQSTPQYDDRQCSRRRMCEACIGGMAVFSTAMVGFPILSFLESPAPLNLNKPLEVPLDQLSAMQSRYAEYHGQQLILFARSNGPVVFSAACPHLGCNVAWDAADALFRCPCHGAVFNADGQVIRGPVSASLRRVPCEVKDGNVVVSTEL